MDNIISEIKRVKQALEKTNSKYLKNDYSKHLRKLTNKLKNVCYTKHYNYKETKERLGI